MFLLGTIIICFIALIVAVFRESDGTTAQSALVGWLLLNVLIFLLVWLEWSIWKDHVFFMLELSFVSFLVLFAHELRRVLNLIDMRPKWQFKTREEQLNLQDVRKELIWAAESLSKKKEGALIVIQQRADLSEFLSGGIVINSQVKASLIHAIFCHNGNDFHDGAIVIREGKIWQAKAFLPMPHSIKLSQKYGTRHLAAVGITDHTDVLNFFL